MPTVQDQELKEYVADHVFFRNGERWGFQFRPHLMNPRFASLVAASYWRSCIVHEPHQVCGIEFGGIPLSFAIAGSHEDSQSCALAMRKEVKSFTNNSLIEGLIENKPIVLVDDVLSSGRSLQRAYNECLSIRLNVVGVYTIIDFERNLVSDEISLLPRWSSFKIQDFGIDEFVWEP